MLITIIITIIVWQCILHTNALFTNSPSKLMHRKFWYAPILRSKKSEKNSPNPQSILVYRYQMAVITNNMWPFCAHWKSSKFLATIKELLSDWKENIAATVYRSTTQILWMHPTENWIQVVPTLPLPRGECQGVTYYRLPYRWHVCSLPPSDNTQLYSTWGWRLGHYCSIETVAAILTFKPDLPPWELLSLPFSFPSFRLLSGSHFSLL